MLSWFAFIQSNIYTPIAYRTSGVGESLKHPCHFILYHSCNPALGLCSALISIVLWTRSTVIILFVIVSSVNDRLAFFPLYPLHWGNSAPVVANRITCYCVSLRLYRICAYCTHFTVFCSYVVLSLLVCQRISPRVHTGTFFTCIGTHISYMPVNHFDSAPPTLPVHDISLILLILVS